MMLIKSMTVLGAAAIAVPVYGGGEWVDFVNETGTRLVATAALGSNDTEEKDYAWGDLDGDGWIDLVVVRKQEFTTTGKRPNVLFMNEAGVLTDRTVEYASSSSIGGDNGFLTPTNDRDVIIVDVDNDGWLDVVTATTLTDNQAKHLSHPRVYMNLGEISGVWQGLHHEDNRIPMMHATAGPRFCSVAAGDLTGNGAPDLYFGDYDSGGTQIMDYNNRVLINNGNGFFTDLSTTVLPTSEMRLSAFGAASVIADMNNDGVLDVVKQTSLNPPQHIALNYNDPFNEGVFNVYDVVYTQAPYFVSTGDLNNDGLLDLIITDDNDDRFLLSQGGAAPNFSSHAFLLQSGLSESAFGSNSLAADLDEDGWTDVIIADVDVDIPNCGSDRMHIYRNLGGTPGGVVTIQELGQVIPFSASGGVHDMAVFDINNDGALDMVVGRCSTTEVYIQQQDSGLAFSYPGGLPFFITPGETTSFQVQLTATGGTPEPGSGRLFVSVNDGPFVQETMNVVAGDLYEAVLPAAICADSLRFYLEGDLTGGGGTFRDPPSAPAVYYSAVSALGTQITFEDEMEGDVTAWTIESDAGLSFGEWEQADPAGTIDLSTNKLAAPFDDNSDNGFMAFVTENGIDNEPATAHDVDGGPTHLISPTIDLAGTDAFISYSRWFYTQDPVNDKLTISVSNDNGDNWVNVEQITSTDDGGNTAWDGASFLVSNHVTPTSQVRVRFTTIDQPNNSVTEAGIDSFRVEEFTCAAPCTGDVATPADGQVNISDLLALLAGWGGNDPDLDLVPDGVVNISDLLALLSAWGPCP